METTHIKCHSNDNGHVILDVPTKYRNKDLEILIVINKILSDEKKKNIHFQN